MHLQFTFTRSSESAPLPPRAAITQGPVSIRQAPRPAIWSELHQRALTHEGDDSEWLADFGRRVVARCNCKQQWDNDTKETPANFDNYFAWTVAIHNAVNRRLKKPILTIEEARAVWTQLLP